MIDQTTRQNISATQGGIASRVVTFEATELEELSRQITGWLLEHPSSTLLAVSHAAETRFVVRNPPSLAGPEPRVFYTGILIVQA